MAFDEAPIKSLQAAAWLESIKTSYDLRKRQDLAIPTMGLNMKPHDDHLTIFEFQPKPGRSAQQIARGETDARGTR